MKAPDVQHKTAISYDGTAIAYQVRGEGPAIVLSNGLGGTYSTYRHQYAMLGEQYKIISWDYRGLFRSGRPPNLSSVAIHKQVRDLEVVLEAEEVDRALFIGWSMGVQYNFEYYRNHADQFAGLIVLDGVAASPFETAFPGLPVKQLVPIIVAAMKVFAGAIGPVAEVVTRAPGLLWLFKLSGLAARGLDQDVFDDLTKEYATIDFEAYGETLARLGEHDASDLLDKIHVPALLITGTKDFFTPMETIRAMAKTIPDAELVLVEGGTHYTAVEYPDEVNGEILAYLKKIKYGPLGLK